MKKTNKETDCWLGSFTRKDFDAMIQYRFQGEIEKRYGQEMQSFCRTLSFGLASISNCSPGMINQALLKNIIYEA